MLDITGHSLDDTRDHEIRTPDDLPRVESTFLITQNDYHSGVVWEHTPQTPRWRRRDHRQGRPGEEAGHRPLLHSLRERDGTAVRSTGRLPLHGGELGRGDNKFMYDLTYTTTPVHPWVQSQIFINDGRLLATNPSILSQVIKRKDYEMLNMSMKQQWKKINIQPTGS